MRNEMIGAVVRRAIEHPEFRDQLIDNPQSALEAHGFQLGTEEMARIKQLGEDLGGSDAEQKLITIAEEYGVHPKPGETTPGLPLV